MSERYIKSNHAVFVDALRACLGLQPLYGNHAPQGDWWHAAYLNAMANRDGRTPRKVSS